MDHEKLVNQKLADKQLRANLDSAMHTLQGNRNRLSTTKFKNFDESQVVIYSSTPIGQNKTLHVIGVNGKKLLIGVSNENISLIKDINV